VRGRGGWTRRGSRACAGQQGGALPWLPANEPHGSCSSLLLRPLAQPLRAASLPLPHPSPCRIPPPAASLPLPQPLGQQGGARSDAPSLTWGFTMSSSLGARSASFCRRSSVGAVGNSTAARLSPVHAPTASPSSQISPASGPFRPSASFRPRRICSTSGAAALNCCRMPPGPGVGWPRRGRPALSAEACKGVKCMGSFISRSQEMHGLSRWQQARGPNR
jgi:hypothetical protein